MEGIMEIQIKKNKNLQDANKLIIFGNNLYKDSNYFVN